MAPIPNFTEDISFISKLGDNPNTDNGFTPEQLKAEFDKAALQIQNFINTYIVPALNSEVSSDAFLKLTGGTMKGNIAMNGNKVTGLADAAADGDAVSKAFLTALLQKSVFGIAQGGTGGKTAEEARANLDVAKAQHNHKASEISEWTQAALTALLAAGYMVASPHQIKATVEDIPADAPENAVFFVPVEG